MGEAIKAGAMPVLCGGEHITTIGGSMAVDRHAPSGTYGLILVDTHLDTAPDVGGERINHCCPITRAMELDAFDPAKCVIIGPHGAMNPKSEYAYVRDAGVKVYHVSDVDRRGARAVAEEAVAIASDGTDGVYFSFDVDSLDSSVCAGHVRAHHGRPDRPRGADDGRRLSAAATWWRWTSARSRRPTTTASRRWPPARSSSTRSRPTRTHTARTSCG